MNNKRLVRFLSLLSAPALLAFLVAPAGAQWRYVVVNGQQLHPAQIAQLERLYCSPIANGRYWYNSSTGLWGYEGDPRPQGYFAYRCGAGNNANGQRRSLSERGLLYSTHEILSGRP
jgi:hypothetical protein